MNMCMASHELSNEISLGEAHSAVSLGHGGWIHGSDREFLSRLLEEVVGGDEDRSSVLMVDLGIVARELACIRAEVGGHAFPILQVHKFYN